MENRTPEAQVQEIREEYRVDQYGLVRTPGKFEAEMAYVPFLWNQPERADVDDGQLLVFRITPELRALFPEAQFGRRRTIRLREDDYGFVSEV